MDDSKPGTPAGGHSHLFLGEAHERSERNVWAVIALTSFMMIAEIGGGAMFGSIALIADGFHMSTHAGAMLLAALAYAYARRRADDPRFTFGTGKFGDLAGFASAIVLAMIAALIAYESIGRFFAPTPIAFAQAIPIAVLGLAVNASSAWLLSRGGHERGHGRGRGHAHHHGHAGAGDSFYRDNNMRAAILHVTADAAVSIFVIVGLLLARGFGWLWMDPVAGLAGAGVIASWSAGLIRDTGAVLLDMNPDRQLAEALRRAIERDGDRLVDLHLWRLGPGHLGAILSIETTSEREASHYRETAMAVRRFSHLTIEIARRPRSAERAPRRLVARSVAPASVGSGVCEATS
ncbi:MAG: CDF family Co(II)/Ni(II) efflux transporter DmeF [Roseiarcus sp.]|jgi:cation diffusion facilitator family transporter